MEKILILSVVFIISCSVGAISKVNQPELRDALLSSLYDEDYIRVVKGSDEYDIELLSSNISSDFKIYKFTSLEPSFNEHDFIFAKNLKTRELVLLTESVNNFNSLLSDEILSVEQANAVVKEFLNLTRPFYKLFIVIDSEQKAKDWLNDSIKFDFTPIQMQARGDEKKFVGRAYLLIGKKLIERTITICGTNLNFSDELLNDKAGKFLSPHY